MIHENSLAKQQIRYKIANPYMVAHHVQVRFNFQYHNIPEKKKVLEQFSDQVNYFFLPQLLKQIPLDWAPRLLRRLLFFV